MNLSTVKWAQLDLLNC